MIKYDIHLLMTNTTLKLFDLVKIGVALEFSHWVIQQSRISEKPCYRVRYRWAKILCSGGRGLS